MGDLDLKDMNIVSAWGAGCKDARETHWSSKRANSDVSKMWSYLPLATMPLLNIF